MASITARLLRWRYARWRCAAVTAAVAGAGWFGLPWGAVVACSVDVRAVVCGVVVLIGLLKWVDWGFVTRYVRCVFQIRQVHRLIKFVTPGARHP
jgi:hypothetical protein